MRIEQKEMRLPEFIRTVFIDQLGSIVQNYPFHSFLLLAVGIEFLGQCINDKKKWHASAKSGTFNDAINRIGALKEYRVLAENTTFYHMLRNGFAHTMLPNSGLSLTSTGENHFGEDQIRLSTSALYSDFMNACEEVIKTTDSYPDSSKEKKPVLYITNIIDEPEA